MPRDENTNGTLNAYTVYGYEVQSGDRFGYKIVAKVWEDGKSWCAFRGLTDWTDEEVVARGDEVHPSIAEYLFPKIAGNIDTYVNW